MPRLDRNDLGAATLIAILTLLVLFFVWPGFWRYRPKDVAGYWVSQRTSLPFRVEVGDSGVLVLTPDGAGAGAVLRGDVRLRRLRVDAPGGGRSGTINTDGRIITWSDGDVWWRQGLTD